METVRRGLGRHVAVGRRRGGVLVGPSDLPMEKSYDLGLRDLLLLGWSVFVGVEEGSSTESLGSSFAVEDTSCSMLLIGVSARSAWSVALGGARVYSGSASRGSSGSAFPGRTSRGLFAARGPSVVPSSKICNITSAMNSYSIIKLTSNNQSPTFPLGLLSTYRFIPCTTSTNFSSPSPRNATNNISTNRCLFPLAYERR